jgi:putative ABC transport system permease protein
MFDDFKYALRSLRSARGVSITAILVLTLAIGATTALFSVVDAVALRGLPFDEHDGLVAVGERRSQRVRVPGDTRDPDELSAVAPQNYLDWAAQQDVFQGMAAIASGWLTLHQQGGQPESLVPQFVTAEFFEVLRVHPVLGRNFTKANEIAGQDRVIILSDGLWRRVFGADPQAIGRTVTLDDVERGRATYEVLGVMPPGFSYPVGATRATDAWLPYVVPPAQRMRSSSSRYNYLQVIARLRHGISRDQAQAQMDQVAVSLQTAYPDWNKDSLVGVRPLVDHIVGARTKSWMLMLLGTVALVLLIACANVANLLLARATSREREISVRAALGASRARVMRQLIAESLVLSIVATLCALPIAWWTIGMLKAAMPESVPRVTTIGLDFRVLITAAILSVATALLFGIVPALQVSKTNNLALALKESGRTTAAGARRTLRNGLVVAEVALAVVLLVGAALFIGSFVAVLRVDLGFSTDHVLTAQVSPRTEQNSEDSSVAFADLVERVGQIPGVLHAAMIGGTVPLQGGYSATSLTIPDKGIDLRAGERIGISTVTPAYHRALRVPLRRGRLFEATDRKDAAPVAIINESAARKFFAGEDPVGREVGIDGLRTIVGVVGDFHQTSLEMAPRPEAYVPMAQSHVRGGALVIRTVGEPYDTLAAVKTTMLAVLPDVPLRNVMTLDELFARRVAQRRVNMLLLGLFGALGLLISAVGVYGLMSYVVSLQTREIGVRIALGATPSRVVGMVVLNGITLVALGLLLGLTASWYLSAAAKAFLFGIEATDPRAFGAAILSLAGAALLAVMIPARRAARVDPMVALRAE